MRRAFTIIELLVAMVITLIMMGAVATLFQNVMGGINTSRATIEMTERLRSATSRLQLDLDGATCVTLPPRRPESDEGYFEIIEGLQTDATNAVPAAGQLDLSRFGDVDDVLMFTTRTRGEPFVGNIPKYIIDSTVTDKSLTTTLQSQTAEVIYWLSPSPTSTALNPQFTLYRRMLLVLPGLKIPDGTDAQDIRERTDVSIRALPKANASDPQKWQANSLGDLTKRENRFAHFGNYPFPVDFTNLVVPRAGLRYGEDAILSNVLAWDVLVYDPGLALKFDASKSYYMTPRDPGWTAGAYPNQAGGEAQPFGAFVDLAYMNGGTNNQVPGFPPPPQMSFQNRPSTKSNLANAYNPIRHTFDTFSAHYENNNIDDDGDGAMDMAVNGFDDNGDGVVDDPDENETAPPYAAPLRGVRVVFRVYEPDSRQIKEVGIESAFTPE